MFKVPVVLIVSYWRVHVNKFELHTHTSECDKCASVSGAEIVRLYHDAGYSGIVITDHYFSLFYEWFKEELCLAEHKKVIDRYLKGYYSACNEGERLGFTVLCGAEVRFDGMINDYLVYGLEESDFYKLPLLNSLKNVEELVSILPEEAMVVQAHPFRDKMIVGSPERLSGIEAYNGRTDSFRNEMAKMYAKHYGKIITSGSDFHSIADLARGGIATEHKICTSRDLCDVLRSGDYTLIEKE